MLPSRTTTNAILILSIAFSRTAPAICGEKNADVTPAAQPNIVLLFVDDLGWNDLGYRNARFETPHIDQLRAESLDFQRAYVASPTCSPSRATLITGKHPARLQIVRHIPTNRQNGFDEFGRSNQEFNHWEGDPAQFPCRNWLPLEHTTYAEALKELGYKNHFVGKWHLGHEPFHPVHQGFDSQYGTTNFGHPKSYKAPFFKNSDVLKEVKEGHLTRVLTDASIRLIDQADRKQPFMLSLWYYGVHRPPIARADLLKHFLGEGYEEADAIYAAQVKAVDESVGRIRDAIAAKGIAGNTVIVFSSDQGSLYSNAPLRGSKRVDTLCEGGARVPLLFHWPGVTEQNSRTDVPVQSTDLFPTFVDIAGGNSDSYKNLDGVSLMPVIRGTTQTLERTLPIIGYRAYEDQYASVRKDAWNLLAYRSGKRSLYNVVSDISEEMDVSDSHPEIVRKLTESLIAWEKDTNVFQYSGLQKFDPDFKHLFGATLLLRKLKQVDPTQEQLVEFDRLSRAFKADVMALRKSAGIDKGLIRVRDKAYKSLLQTELTGDALWLKLQQQTGISDEQREAFQKTKETSDLFKASVRKLLTDKQRAEMSGARAQRKGQQRNDSKIQDLDVLKSGAS